MDQADNEELKGNPGVEALRTDPKYRLVDEFSFEDMIPFVFTHIKEKGIMSTIYMAVNLLMLLLVVLIVMVELTGEIISWRILIGQTLAGIASGSILVIPVHEMLHGLTYRILGARKIQFGIDIKQFIFFVTADRCPVSGVQLYFLALTPFAVINLATIVINSLIYPEMILFSAFFLLSHNLMCIGDFAVANYVWRKKGKLYTYDEPEKKKSYFYERVNPE